MVKKTLWWIFANSIYLCIISHIWQSEYNSLNIFSCCMESLEASALASSISLQSLLLATILTQRGRLQQVFRNWDTVLISIACRYICVWLWCWHFHLCSPGNLAAWTVGFQTNAADDEEEDEDENDNKSIFYVYFNWIKSTFEKLHWLSVS